MKLAGKKVLVTGGDGFVGSHLVEELVKIGADVTAFVFYNSQNKIGNLDFVPKEILSQVKIIFGDIVDFGAVKDAAKKQDIVFHLAALIAIPYSYLAPEAYVMTNVMGTLHVLQACREMGIQKIVHTSTSETYGSAIYTPIDEKHPLQAQSPYSATKIGADKIAESFYCSFNLPVATIRPFNTYGTRQSARAVIPTVICQALSGKKEIKLGALSPVRDMNYVKDSVAGYIQIAEADNTVGEVINIGSGKGITIGVLANKILELTGSKAKIISDEVRIRPEKSEVKQLICNFSKAKKLIGYEPKYSLENGLKETINYIKGNLNIYKPDEYTI
ncbi:MAG: UDP-glucose 4-epimerase [Candidatus Saganbacteria bacterium]|uniref:UDP-glucose 4-epimerase n=1 Tax=Candidatus Saganbacteria bacterium TaxID=2575572 RepID=A0A833P3M8_UNCSA|nr:MAG: UDP-glucose 4-epimerase [Candidatus Saganbacteria bacterium]